jgi:hypothetical protein
MGKSVEYQLLANFHRNLLTDVDLRLISLFRQIMVEENSLLSDTSMNYRILKDDERRNRI